MRRRGADRLAAAGFFASVAVMGVFYGVFAMRNDWFPSRQIDLAVVTAGDLYDHWQNDLSFTPTRHLVPSRRTGGEETADGFRLLRPGEATPGYVLVSGLSPEPEVSFHVVTLYDEEGRQVHRWPIHYDRIDPGGQRPQNVMLHGMEVFEDGSIVVTFDVGEAMARLSPCGDPIWVTKGTYHHSIARDGKGGLWSWRGDDIVRLDEETGEPEVKLSLPADVYAAGPDQLGVFGLRAITEDADEIMYYSDPFHTNDVEPLRAEMADAFPMFEEGDLLVSLREINLVAVIAAEDGRLRWYKHGPWHRQHDPDFQPDGTITVFDNGTGSGRSRILRVDPATNEVTEALVSREDAPFYTWRRGKHQILPDGTLLVTETERGRVFEAAPDGSRIWERDMPWDAERNLIVTEARHVPPDFFRNGVPRCD
jgi:hypothetical protein